MELSIAPSLDWPWRIVSLFVGTVVQEDAVRSAGSAMRVRSPDIHYRMAVAFLEAVNGAKRRITMPDGKTIDLTIPSGTRNESALRLKGKGHPGLGGKVEVPTVSGRVIFTIPPSVSCGHVMRLKGKGVKATGRPAGDHLVRLSIAMPQEIDPELEAFARKWRDDHAYDPRGNLKNTS